MTIFDVRITDVTAKSYQDGTTTSNLQRGGNLKKRKHLKSCLEARRSFTLLVFSSEVCMGKETNAAFKRLAALLSKKWDREYVAVCGYVRARLSLSLKISLSHLLRGEMERKGGGGGTEGKTSRGRDIDAADGPRSGRVENEEMEE